MMITKCFLTIFITCTGAVSRFQEDDLNFGIVIDAGSSGSRAYLYKWTNANHEDSLLNIEPMMDNGNEPLMKSVSPGLSSFGMDPTKVGEYISPLLNFAAENIPENKHLSTKLFLLATAGMRLLQNEQQKSILYHLWQFIYDNFKFECPESNLEIISGKDEGIYQWISVNFVLGKLNGYNKSSHQTVGALDMGGASLQIAVEVPEGQRIQSLSVSDRDHIEVIDLGDSGKKSKNTYNVFVSTFLGFGANEAMARHTRSLVLSQVGKGDPRKIKGISPTNPVEDPCISKGLAENLTLALENMNLKQQDKKKFKKIFGTDLRIYLQGSGNWDQCYASLSKSLRSRESYLKSCESGSHGCPDREISKPPIDVNKLEFYGFSEFWYTAEDVMRLGGVYSFEKFKDAAKKFCSQDWLTTEKRYDNGDYPLADLGRMRSQCFKSAWVPVALHQGLGFPEYYSKLTASPNQHQGKVIHWTLGALVFKIRSKSKRYTDQESRPNLRISFEPYDSNFQFFLLFVLATLLAFIFLYARKFRRMFAPLKIQSLAAKTLPSSQRSFKDDNGWTIVKVPNDMKDFIEISSKA